MALLWQRHCRHQMLHLTGCDGMPCQSQTLQLSLQGLQPPAGRQAVLGLPQKEAFGIMLRQ